MPAFPVMTRNHGNQTAAGTGLIADLACLFVESGGNLGNSDLNAQYGDRFHPAKVGSKAGAGTPAPRTTVLMAAAKARLIMGFYSSFYSISNPDSRWAFNAC